MTETGCTTYDLEKSHGHPDTAVNLEERFTAFTGHRAPKIISQINDLHLKAVKLEGVFVWHTHNTTDEFFLVRDE